MGVLLPLLPALLGACAEPAPAPPVPVATDERPGKRTASAGGRWEAIVAEGGALTLRGAGADRRVDTDVDPRVAFSPDERTLVYARRGPLMETDLWRVDLPDGAPRPLTDWPGSEDRPVFSPDGARVAFVAAPDGLAAWWVIGADGSGGRQVTNVGVRKTRPGVPPEGWVPVPDGPVYAWTKDGLAWVAGGARHRAVP